MAAARKGEQSSQGTLPMAQKPRVRQREKERKGKGKRGSRKGEKEGKDDC